MHTQGAADLAVRLQRTLAAQGVGDETSTEATLTNACALAMDEAVRVGTARTAPVAGPAAITIQGLPELKTGPEDADDVQFVLREVLGEGGMGRVTLAEQRSLRREVAVKVVRDEVAQAPSTNALLQEGLFTGYLEHPNIVPVHLLGRDPDGRPMLVMKRVEGVEWKKMLADPDHPRWGAVTTDRLRFGVDVLMQVCNALHFAHSRAIVHRDVKPENVMIGAFGEVYLLDWGIAVRTDQHRPASTSLCGSPAYMAPEMLDGAARVDARTDVYLLGATLHEVLTGRPRHRAASVIETLVQVHASEPVDYGPDVPAELASLCNRATARDPADRPPSAVAFKAELQAFLQHRGSVALSQRTAGHLAALEALLDAPQLDQQALTAVFSECRFGFRQALHEWPENAAAHAGLQRALELRIERALADRDESLATSLVAELPEPRPALAERLAALHREREDEVRSRARLRRLVFDMDVGISSRERARLALLIGVMVAPVTLTLGLLRRYAGWEIDYPVAIALSSASLVVLVAATIHWRRAVWLTTINRRLAATLVIGTAGMLMVRIVGAIAAVDIDFVFALDMFAVMLVALVAGAGIDRRLLPVAIIPAVGTVTGAACPYLIFEVQTVAGLATCLCIAWVWRHDTGPARHGASAEAEDLGL